MGNGYVLGQESILGNRKPGKSKEVRAKSKEMRSESKEKAQDFRKNRKSIGRS